MGGVRRYRITSCCEQDVSTDVFNIPSSGLVADGVYVYNGTSFEESTTGMWFYNGYCYTVEYLGTNFSFYPTAFNQADITFVSNNDCNNINCAACEIALPEAYSVFACCDTANVVNINIDFSGCGVYTTTYKYTGPGFVTDSGFVFESEQCYNIQSIDNGVYNVGPPCEDLEPGLGSYRDCEAAINDGFCPACELGLQYLIFTNCCTTETILFKGIDANLYYGVQEYIGIPVDGLVNKCYGIEIGIVGDATVPDIAAYNALPSPPLYNAGVNFISINNKDTDCINYIAQCPSCTIPCYTLYNCDGNNFNTTSDLSSNVGTWVTISNSEGPVAGTWLVLENTGNCKNAVNDITVVLADVTPCPINCYQITGNPTTVTYINSDLELIVQLGGGKVCSYITPIVTGPAIGYVVELGLCVGGVCPEICFEFTNCQTSEILVVSNSSTVIPYYAQEQVVTLQGYDGCWSIDITEVCDCPVSVTILTAYASCPACLPIVNYKFTNCNNQSIIRYSTEDYSEYVGKTVKLECGECWFVSEINYNPPSTQTINITFTFDSCVACAKTYYKLTNCTDDTEIIYTDSALNLIAPQISTFDTSPTVNNDCSNEFARVTYTYEGIEYVKDLSNVGNIDNENIYVYTNNLDNNIFFLRYVSDTNLWTIFFENNETAIVATSPDFINWTGENGYTNISVNLITLSNPCITVVLDGIEYTLQSTGEEDGKSVYFYISDVGFDTFEVISLAFNPDTWYLNIGIEATQYQLNSDIDIPISTSWSFVEGTPFNTVSTIACNCEGFIVSIKECPGCWIVTETSEPINPTTVTQLKSYDDCVACQSVVPCVCSTLRNDTGEATSFAYLDCTGISLDTGIIKPGETSEKYCLSEWLGKAPLQNYIEYFGNCINGVCPPVVYPKRKVKPGYSVPTCDIEKYEKITCRSSEILYKQVIRLRYGISNCCPEDDEKWLIKKELIDLDALRDPDYICKPVTSCCNQPINDCGCNTLKTCNSQ
jgi:hypothetical protein